LVTGVREMATKVYVNDKHEAIIVCEKCGKWREKEVSSFINTNRLLRVKCACENIFNVFLEVRSCYRKKTDIKGVYIKKGERKEEIIFIEDISQKGVRLRTKYRHNIQVGDVLNIRCSLDNERHAEISKHVLVKYIKDCLIGTQFCASDMYSYKKEIGSYLMTN
jgi:hypothetical protein